MQKHVFLCTGSDSVVFLDLKRDEYNMLAGEKAVAFSRLIDPPCGALVAGHVPSQDGPDTAGIVGDLLSEGVLTEDVDAGKPIRATAIDPPMESLLELESIGLSEISLLVAWRACLACTMTALKLKFSSIKTVVDSVAQIKVDKKVALGNPSLERIRDLTWAFLRLRLLFPKENLCLFDSLALIYFLGYYGVFPTWVFGVRPAQWGAHCWVQLGPVLLNESVEAAEDYIPIMAV